MVFLYNRVNLYSTVLSPQWSSFIAGSIYRQLFYHHRGVPLQQGQRIDNCFITTVEFLYNRVNLYSTVLSPQWSSFIAGSIYRQLFYHHSGVPLEQGQSIVNCFIATVEFLYNRVNLYSTVLSLQWSLFIAGSVYRQLFYHHSGVLYNRVNLSSTVLSPQWGSL